MDIIRYGRRRIQIYSVTAITVNHDRPSGNLGGNCAYDKRKTASKAQKKAPEKSSSEDSVSSSETRSSEDETVEGRASTKLTWSFSQYGKPKPVKSKGKPLWRFNCRYCLKFGCCPRTEGLEDWDKETLKLKATSNFINHAEECERRPPAQSWEAYQTARERQRQGLPALPLSSDPSPFEAEQGMMQDFIQRGIDNPAKVVTNKTYRKHLVEAIVEDDLAFSVAEGGGTLRLLTHLAPRGIKPRVSHQTVRRDIDELHTALKNKLAEKLKKESGEAEMSEVEEEGAVDLEGSSSEDSSDSEYEEVEESDVEWEDVTPKPVKRTRKKKKAKAPKVFTPVDKVHSVAVHILRSEIRRKKARRLIRRKVSKEYRHLVFIRSMKAFDSFVSELPTGLTGKAKRVAQARKKNGR
ncbi:hypothetical protein B0H11DRAFT_1902484 [Mycena galericulata]|nr:hypothetical protein B0H11DRAFT_1902484 [Mycena galericulata]